MNIPAAETKSNENMSFFSNFQMSAVFHQSRKKKEEIFLCTHEIKHF